MSRPTESVSPAKAQSILIASIAAAGSLRAFARSHKLSAAYVSDVQRGSRPIGPKLAAALGLSVHTRRVTIRTYTRALTTPSRVNPFAR